jgi:hypothetical protein
MNLLQKRFSLAAAILVALAVAAWWYWSPYVALYQMRNAALEHDADAFNDHVDYPRVRDSLKGQLAARMTGGLAARPRSDNPLENAGAALGSMLGMALADKAIDVLVRPETVMQAMKNGSLRVQSDDGQAQSGPDGDGNAKKPDWHTERTGADRMLVVVNPRASAPGKHAAVFVLQREGFAHWKLTGIRLPD